MPARCILSFGAVTPMAAIAVPSAPMTGAAIAIPSLAYEEVVSEKVRAASQRSKIRTMNHDGITTRSVANSAVRRHQDGLLTVRRFLDGARGGIYMQPKEIDRDFAPYSDSELVFR